MPKHLALCLILSFQVYAADFEFVVAVPQNKLDQLVLRIIEESCMAAGSSVNYIFDNDPIAIELTWSYPETIEGDWRLVSPQLLGGFGGLVTLQATEEDLNSILTVKNLGSLKSLPLQALVQSKDPWLPHWQKSGLPFRIDNTTPNLIRRGLYRPVPVWQISLEGENSTLPLQPLKILLRANTDLSLYTSGTRVSPLRLDSFRKTLDTGLRILKETRRLDFIIRQWFLNAFRELQIQKLSPIPLSY